MASGWRTAVSQNLVANLIWALPGWIANSGFAVGIGYMSGLSSPWLVLIAISTLFITGLLVALKGLRDAGASRPTPDRQTERLGETDGITLLRVDGRLIELDSSGEESFSKLDERELPKFRERISKLKRTKFSRYDFTQWFSHQGKEIIDEPVYVGLSQRRVRFWTRSEIDGLQAHERSALPADVRRWYTGKDEEHERLKARLGEANGLLRDIDGFIFKPLAQTAPAPRPPGNQSADLADAGIINQLVELRMRTEGNQRLLEHLPAWAEKMRRYLSGS